MAFIKKGQQEEVFIKNKDANLDTANVAVANITTLFVDTQEVSDLEVKGTLQVTGTPFTVDWTDVTAEQKTITLNDVPAPANPTDTNADQGGIILKGSTDKTILYDQITDSWTFTPEITTASLSDVDLTTNAPQPDEALIWDQTLNTGAGGWKPGNVDPTSIDFSIIQNLPTDLTGYGIIASIDDLSDVDTSTVAPTADQILIWNAQANSGTGGWEPADNVPGSVDWSTVTNTPTDLAGYGITDALTTSSTLDDLVGVDITTTPPTADQILKFDATLGANGEWVPADNVPPSVDWSTITNQPALSDLVGYNIVLTTGSTLNQLADISNATPTADQILKYSPGSGWLIVDNVPGSIDWSTVTNTPTDLAGYGITDALSTSTVLSDLVGVSATTPSQDQILKFDTSNGWEPADNVPGSIDWSTITSTPTDLAGYGITNALDDTTTLSDLVGVSTTAPSQDQILKFDASNGWEPVDNVPPSVDWTTVTSTPTTLVGYGITNALDDTTTLSDLVGVSTTAPSQDQILVFDANNGWEPKDNVPGSIDWSTITSTPTTLTGYGITDALNTSTVLSDLVGVSTTAPSQDQILVFDASNGWEPKDNVADGVDWANITGTPTTLSGYNISDALNTATAVINDLNDVDTTGLQADQVLKWDGSSNWIPTSVTLTETVTSLTYNSSSHELTYTDESGTSTVVVDLSVYIDSIATITSGSFNSTTGIVTYTRTDNTTFTIDFSALLPGITYLSTLSDTNLTGANAPSDKEVLVWNQPSGSSGEWIAGKVDWSMVDNTPTNFTGYGIIANLDDLANVDTTGATLNKILIYNGTSWEVGDNVPGSVDWSTITNTPTDLAGYGITDALSTSTTLSDLVGVSTTAPTQDQILVFDASNGWQPQDNVADAVDWSSITNKPTTVATSGLTDALDDTTTLSDLVGVSSTTPTNGQILIFDSTNGWEPGDVPIQTTVDWSTITNTPTDLAGYGITDALSTSTVLSDLVNVSTTAPSQDQILVFDSTNGWEPQDNIAGAVDWTSITNKPTTVATSGLTDALDDTTTLSDLVGVSTAAPSQDQILVFDSTNGWQPQDNIAGAVDWTSITNKPTTVATSGLTDALSTTSQLSDLANVHSTAPTAGQILVFDSTNGWQPQDNIAGAVDWTSITNKPTTVATSGLTDALDDTTRVQDLANVSSTTPTAGQILIYHAVNGWEPSNVPAPTAVAWTSITGKPTDVATSGLTDALSTSSTLNDLSGVNVQGATQGQVLQFDSTNGWEPATPTTFSETVTALSYDNVNNILSYTDESNVTNTINLSYLIDQNLPFISSGSFDPATKLFTLTRDDGSSFTVNLAGLASIVSLSGLTDTDIGGTPTDQYVLTWDSSLGTSGKWTAAAIPTPSSLQYINDISNVDAPTALLDQALLFNPSSGNWEASDIIWSKIKQTPTTVSASGLTDALSTSSTLGDLSGVDLTTIVPTVGKALVYNGTNWVADILTVSNITMDIGDLQDVNTSNPIQAAVQGSALVWTWNGSNFEWQPGTLQAYIGDLFDVDTTTAPQTNELLVWDSGSSKWKPGKVDWTMVDNTPTDLAGYGITDSVMISGVNVINDLADINSTAPSDGEVLTWDATASEWKPEVIASPTSVAWSAITGTPTDFSGYGIVASIDDLSDVDTSTNTPTNNQVLTWDSSLNSGSGGWKPADVPPATETLTTLVYDTLNNNLIYTDENSQVTTISLAQFVDTNLSRITSGTYNSSTNKIRFDRSADNTFVEVDLSALVSGAGASVLTDLTDVQIVNANLTGDELLSYDNSTSLWKAVAKSSVIPTSIGSFSDVDLTGITSGQVLKWVNNKFEAADDVGGSSYADSDVDTHLNTFSATSGQILSWNGTDYAWVADQIGSNYADSDVDTHLNVSGVTTGHVLSWNGTDYAWVAQSGGSGGGSSTLAGLTDTNTTNHPPQATDVLTWTANNTWEPQEIPASFDGDYNSLTNKPTLYVDSDVDTHLNQSSATTGQILSWNGTDYAWVADQTGSGGSSTLAGLSDTNTTNHPPVATNVLTWTANNTWEPQEIPAGFDGDYNSLTNTPTLYADSDVNTLLNQSSATTGQILSWNGSDYAWVADQTGSGYADSDVDTHLNVSGATTGQILSWNGSDYAWVADQTGSSGSSTLAGLSDTNTTTHPPVATNVLTWTANNTWEPQEIPAGFDGDYNSLTNTPTLYADSDVDTHLNQSSATTGQILSWNGTDYAWVADQTGSGYTDSDVNTLLNQSSATTGQILSWNGSDYAWVADQTGSTIVPNSAIAETGVEVEIIVKVSSKTANHRYNGQGSGSGYIFTIDGVDYESPFLDLVPGKTYKFNQGDSSNSSHGIRFYEDAAKTTLYSTGVTTSGNAGTSGAYTSIAVTTSTLSILHYQCVNHGYMGNQVQVKGVSGSSGSSVSAIDDLSDVDTSTNAPNTGSNLFPDNKDILVWNGSNWIPQREGSGVRLEGLSNVNDFPYIASGNTYRTSMAGIGQQYNPGEYSLGVGASSAYNQSGFEDLNTNAVPGTVFAVMVASGNSTSLDYYGVFEYVSTHPTNSYGCLGKLISGSVPSGTGINVVVGQMPQNGAPLRYFATSAGGEYFYPDQMNIGDLSNVDITTITPSATDVLTWTANNTWEPQEAPSGGGGGGSTTLAGLTDTDTTTHPPVATNVLTWTANNTWEPQEAPSGGGGSSVADITDLSDVDTTTNTPSQGTVLLYTANNLWEPATSRSFGTSHYRYDTPWAYAGYDFSLSYGNDQSTITAGSSYDTWSTRNSAAQPHLESMAIGSYFLLTNHTGFNANTPQSYVPQGVGLYRKYADHTVSNSANNTRDYYFTFIGGSFHPTSLSNATTIMSIHVLDSNIVSSESNNNFKFEIYDNRTGTPSYQTTIDVPEIPISLDDLMDVQLNWSGTSLTTTGPVANNVLQYSANGYWQAIEPVIDNLADVDTVSIAPSDGDVLTWDGTINQWKPLASQLGSVASITELGDVDTTTITPSINDVLVWTANNTFETQNAGTFWKYNVPWASGGYDFAVSANDDSTISTGSTYDTWSTRTSAAHPHLESMAIGSYFLLTQHGGSPSYTPSGVGLYRKYADHTVSNSANNTRDYYFTYISGSRPSSLNNSTSIFSIHILDSNIVSTESDNNFKFEIWDNRTGTPSYQGSLESPIIPASLGNLADVQLNWSGTSLTTTGPVANNVLQYSANGYWQAIEQVIDNLADVDTASTAPSDGDVLTWDGTTNQWKPLASALGSVASIDELGDVDTTTITPSINDVLVWTANNTFEPQDPGAFFRYDVPWPSTYNMTINANDDSTISTGSTYDTWTTRTSSVQSTLGSIKVGEYFLMTSHSGYPSYTPGGVSLFRCYQEYTVTNSANNTRAYYITHIDGDCRPTVVNNSTQIFSVHKISNSRLYGNNNFKLEVFNNKSGTPSYQRTINVPKLPASLDDLMDVQIDFTGSSSSVTGPTTGDVLTWSANGFWQAMESAGGGSGSYADSDVDTHLNVSSATSGQVLSWNGTDYAWQTGSGGSSTLSGLTDTDTTTHAPQANDVLTWTANSTWEPQQSSSAITIGNLTDVDTTTNVPSNFDVLMWTTNNKWEPTEVVGVNNIETHKLDVSLGTSGHWSYLTSNAGAGVVTGTTHDTIIFNNTDNLSTSLFGNLEPGELFWLTYWGWYDQLAPVEEVGLYRVVSNVYVHTNNRVDIKHISGWRLTSVGQQSVYLGTTKFDKSILSGSATYEVRNSDNSNAVIDEFVIPYDEAYPVHLGLLSNVDTETNAPLATNVLTWTANNAWEPQENPSITSSSIDGLTDVDTSTHPPNLADQLVWTANNTWEPQEIPPIEIHKLDVSFGTSGHWSYLTSNAGAGVVTGSTHDTIIFNNTDNLSSSLFGSRQIGELFWLTYWGWYDQLAPVESVGLYRMVSNVYVHSNNRVDIKHIAGWRLTSVGQQSVYLGTSDYNNDLKLSGYAEYEIRNSDNNNNVINTAVIPYDEAYPVHLGHLADVGDSALGSIVAGDVLTWTANNTWEPQQATGGSGGGSYADSDVDTHLNVSAATSGQILSWNGSDYAWVADQTGSGGGGGSVTKTIDLTGDVSSTIATAGQILMWDGGTGKYVPTDGHLRSFSDVASTQPGDKEVLRWNVTNGEYESQLFPDFYTTIGNNQTPAVNSLLGWTANNAWEPVEPSAGINGDLDALTDVTYNNRSNQSPSLDDVIQWTANNAWEPMTPPQGFDGDYNSLTNQPTIDDLYPTTRADYFGSINHDMIPSSNEVYDLGSSTKKWKDLFLSGTTINLGTVNLKSTASGGFQIQKAAAVGGGNPGDPAPLDTDVDWSNITNVPTTILGYGITDSADISTVDNVGDVDTTTVSATEGTVLTWTANNAWEPQLTQTASSNSRLKVIVCDGQSNTYQVDHKAGNVDIILNGIFMIPQITDWSDTTGTNNLSSGEYDYQSGTWDASTTTFTASSGAQADATHFKFSFIPDLNDKLMIRSY